MVPAPAFTTPFEVIAVANRSVLAELLYYARAGNVPIRAWDRSTVARDHFQMTMPLRPGTRHILVLAAPDESAAMLAGFESHRLIRQLAIPLGRHRKRVLAFYMADFYRGPQFAQ